MLHRIFGHEGNVSHPVNANPLHQPIYGGGSSQRGAFASRNRRRVVANSLRRVEEEPNGHNGPGDEIGDAEPRYGQQAGDEEVHGISKRNIRSKRGTKAFYEAIKKRFNTKASLLRELERHGCEGKVSKEKFLYSLMELLPEFSVEREVERLVNDTDFVDVDNTIGKLYNRLRAAMHSRNERSIEQKKNARKKMALDIIMQTVETIDDKNTTNDETFALCRSKLLEAAEALDGNNSTVITEGALLDDQEKNIALCGR